MNLDSKGKSLSQQYTSLGNTRTKSVCPSQGPHEAIYYVYAYCMMDMKSLCCQLCWFHLLRVAQCDQYAMLLSLCPAYSPSNSNVPSVSSIVPESEQPCRYHQNLSSEHVALLQRHVLPSYHEEFDDTFYCAQASLRDSLDNISYSFHLNL